MDINNQSWDIEDLIRQLEKIYVENKKDKAAWDDENESIRCQLEALSERLGSDYSNPKAIACGGSGILLKVNTERLHQQPRVIKFPRPLPHNAPEFAELLKNEIRLLAEIRSRSIVVIHEAGSAPLSKQVAGLDVVPFYVMDYIEGRDSDDFIRNNQMKFPVFLNIIRETIDAIANLHHKNIIHLDIKPGNIVINKSAQPILLDLGTTKNISNDSGETKIAFTFSYASQQLKQYLKSNPADSNRSEATIKRSDIKLIWDLHALGRTLREWVSIYIEKNSQELSLYQRKYLLLMALRMQQDSYEVSNIEEYGLPHNFLKEIQYKTIDQPLNDIQKIAPGNDLADIIPELDVNHHKTIQGGSLDATTFTERLAKTLDHPIMRRLSEISQLGIVQLVYPTCTHTRLEHSLGTYHNVIKYIRSLYYDPLNPMFRQIMEPEHLRAALLAALLHDAGQFPLAHDLEDIDQTLFNHNSLTEGLLKGERDLKVKGMKKMVFPSLNEMYALWGVDKERVISILKAKTNQLNHNIIDRILKSLISGPIDADKLDYLIRDGQRLQVPYPKGIDVDRLLRCLTLVIKDYANGVYAYIGIHEKGRIPAEFVTLARYAMFSQVYWHHAVRSAKAMLSRAIYALLANFKKPEDKNSFRYEFETFAAFYPKNKKHIQLKWPFEANEIKEKAPNEGIFEIELTGSVLNTWDLSVLLFIKAELEKRELVESELIDDLIKRKLYKRLYNYSKEKDPDVWNGFINQWCTMDAKEKRKAMVQVENAIINAGTQKLSTNPDTFFLTEEDIKSMEYRVKSGKPLILIDIPSERPGSQLPLEFVMEEDRRDLRKSNRICGRSLQDQVWDEYAKKMWEKAGRIRVFVHPDYVEPILSAIDKKWMSDTLLNLSALEDKQ